MSVAIIIPARYGSTRLPGKPLVEIAGHTLLARVIHQAKQALNHFPGSRLVVATDDDRIGFYAKTLGVEVAMTSVNCPSGSDRVFEAYEQLREKPAVIVNLQGDVPLIEPAYIKAVLDTMLTDITINVATPVVQLTWDALKQLEAQKVMTPFSGTTALIDRNGNALWFSKNIVPAVRRRSYLEKNEKYSPVYKHIGLYAYRDQALREFVKLPPSHYEDLEGLEQLRFLENGMSIQCVSVQELSSNVGIGVDSPEDVSRVEQLILEHGDPMMQREIA